MKKIVITLIYITSLFSITNAQQVNEKLKSAESSYSSGNLENARFELQEALNAVNQAIGKEILSKLPDNLDGMSFDAATDNVAGINIGFAGLYVNREYKAENKSMSFQVVNDSPMLTGINALLGMSVFMAADPNQKRIKIDNYKALLTKSEDAEGNVSYEVNLPFGDSLLSLSFNGIAEEEKVMSITKQIPVAVIAEIAQ